VIVQVTNTGQVNFVTRCEYSQQNLTNPHRPVSRAPKQTNWAPAYEFSSEQQKALDARGMDTEGPPAISWESPRGVHMGARQTKQSVVNTKLMRAVSSGLVTPPPPLPSSRLPHPPPLTPQLYSHPPLTLLTPQVKVARRLIEEGGADPNTVCENRVGSSVRVHSYTLHSYPLHTMHSYTYTMHSYTIHSYPLLCTPTLCTLCTPTPTLCTLTLYTHTLYYALLPFAHYALLQYALIPFAHYALLPFAH
jgi:hypothetical protein